MTNYSEVIKDYLDSSINRVNGINIENILYTAGLIAKNEKQPLRLEHVAEATYYETEKINADLDGFSISISDAKNMILSVHKDCTPGNKSRMAELGIVDESYYRRLSSLKKSKIKYKKLNKDAQVLIKKFLNIFDASIQEDSFTTDDYIRLIKGVCDGKGLLDIIKKISYALSKIKTN